MKVLENHVENPERAAGALSSTSALISALKDADNFLCSECCGPDSHIRKTIATALAGAGASTVESLQVEVDQAVRSAWMASRELYRLSLDPRALAYMTSLEGDLWSAKGSIADVCDKLREGQRHAA